MRSYICVDKSVEKVGYLPPKKIELDFQFIKLVKVILKKI